MFALSIFLSKNVFTSNLTQIYDRDPFSNKGGGGVDLLTKIRSPLLSEEEFEYVCSVYFSFRKCFQFDLLTRIRSSLLSEVG